VRALADAEGLSVDAFCIRCVEDAVGHMEAANAEIDAADAQEKDWPTFLQDVADVTRKATVSGFDWAMTDAEMRRYSQRENAARLMRSIASRPDRPAPEKPNRPMPTGEVARRTLEAMGAIPRREQE
jgi:hypothetical protein